jgi:uncharacterized iron-regulated membrane protein
MERRLSAPVVVAAWGALNTLLACLLAGFTAGGVDGGPGSGGALAFAIYAAASALVFAVALLFWLDRRRAAGLRVPARAGAAALLAVGVTLIWLGLAFGAWIQFLAAVPLLAALMIEISAHRG